MNLRELQENLNKVICEREGRKLTIVISNPPVNALSAEVIGGLLSVLDWAEQKGGLDEVVFTGGRDKDGNDRYFSAGADIKELKKVVDCDDPFGAGYDFSSMGQRLISKILRYPKQTTALINGYCFGGALELALACERRVAHSRAWLGFPEATLGLIPGWGGTQILGWKLDRQPALLLMNSVLFRADDLFWKEAEWGAADRQKGKIFDEIISVDNDLPEPPARKPAYIASRVTAPLLAYARLEIPENWHMLFMPCGEEWFGFMHLEQEAIQFALMCQNSDAREGITAFLEKREPRFREVR